MVIIDLVSTLLRNSCGLPRGTDEQSLNAPIRDLASVGVYNASDVAIKTGGLLHRLFTLIRQLTDGLFSVALSMASPPPGLLRATCSMKFGLSSPIKNQGDYPSYSLISKIQQSIRLPEAVFLIHN